MKNILTSMILVLSVSSAALAKNKTVILDVRTSQEFSEEHIDGALNLNVQENDFTDKISKLDKSDQYKVYCRSGRRSGIALEKMKTAGFQNVENLGGLSDAKKALTQQPKTK